jgi:LysM repeat protein
MGFNVGPASGRSLTSAILTLIAFIAVACVAFAAPAALTERDLSSPPGLPARPNAVRSPVKRVQATAYRDEQSGASQEDTDDEAADEGQSAEGVPAAAAAAPSATQSRPVAPGGDIIYAIREGDSVGAISAMFHIPAQEIFRHNHLREDSTLRVGQVLRIPNPYAAQIRALQSQLAALSSRNQEQERKLQDAGTKERAFDARIEELSTLNRALEHDVTMLPWWRRATTVAVTLALVMLGVALVSLLQWFLIRRRFITVAAANEKLTRLDQRYRALLGRAELRLQQLYGRRRPASEISAQVRSQEDFELERLGREVKTVLEQELTQLGVQMHPPARRSRLREWLANLGSPVAVRSDRR